MTDQKSSDIPSKRPADEEPSLQEILVPIWANRKRIFLISFIVALITLGINFLLPVYYKSTATLLPETQKDKLSSLGQFADIANLAGVNVPGSEIARLYPTIITSETILRTVIYRKYKTQAFPDSVNLVQFFEIDLGSPEEDFEGTLKKMRDLLSSSFENRTSVVTLTLELPEPNLVAEVLNGIIAELDQFMRFKKTSNASEQVKWINIRLEEVILEMRLAEDSLRGFRERNRRVLDSPQLMLEQERLSRDVTVKSTIFVELKKQFELARLDEIKNISIVNVLDPASVPVRKVRPTRAKNAALSFVVAIVGVSGFYASRRFYGSLTGKLREITRVPD